MRKLAVCLLSSLPIVFGAGGLLAAQDQRGPGPFEPGVLFQRLDKNHNGKITADEIPDAAPDRLKELLKRADKNQDKAVTADELREAIGPMRPGMAGGPPAGGPPWAARGRGGWGPVPGQPGAGPGFGGAPGAGRPGFAGPRPGAGQPGVPGPMSAGGRPGFGGPAGPMPDAKALFQKLDEDRDGKLSPEEFAEGMKQFHQRSAAAFRRGASPMAGGPPWARGGYGRAAMAGGPPWARGGFGGAAMAGGPPWAKGPMAGGPPWARGGWAHSPAAWARSPMARAAMARGAWMRQHAGAGAPWARQAMKDRSAAHMARPGAERMKQAVIARLKAADKNHDGKLSKDEAPEFLKRHFDKIDANKDGQLDATELKQAAEKHRQEIQAQFASRRAEIEKRIDAARKHHAEGRKEREAKKPIDKKVEERKPDVKKPDEKK